MNPVNSMKYEDVYYVEAENKKHLNPIAIRPKIFEDHIEWDDTSRGGFAKYKEIKMEPSSGGSKENPNKIIVKTNEGDRIIFCRLNLDIYNDKVKEWVYDQPEFKSEKDLKEFYLDGMFRD